MLHDIDEQIAEWDYKQSCDFRDYLDMQIPMGKCLFCGESCEGVLQDQGIGYTEMGSFGHIDSFKIFVSNCCKDKIIAA